MADRAISELIAANQVTPTDLFVLEQSGTAKKLTGQTLENWLVSFADGHGGIQSIVKKSTSGLVDTYRITLADTTTFDFVVNNGRGISGITKTGTNGLVDTYTVQFNDSTSNTFTVTNGEKGDKGDNQYVWIKYASQKPTASSHSFGDVADNWIGIYSGASATAPTDWTQYEWFQIKGEKGDTGEAARLMSSAVEYRVSDSGTIIPSGAWSSSVPVVAQGRYMWTRTTTTFNTGSSVVAYSVSRMGMDGTGAVSSVAGISPEHDGNVPLTASDVGALSNTGGDMTGELRMNGQPISGLHAPTANDQAANMGFVNEQVKKAAPYNHADNSDFSQFVAQAGIGETHGNQAYAGDRWILDNGTVTGIAREDGNGYTNITLNGTIRQKVANAPDVGTAAIEMVSGTADISYANGEITITSNGGVIKNVLLLRGVYDSIPEYHPKGYGAELLECMRYYQVLIPKGFDSAKLVEQAASKLYADFALPVAMRVAPSLINGTVRIIRRSSSDGGTIGGGNTNLSVYASSINRVVLEGSSNFASNTMSTSIDASSISTNVAVSADL